MTSRQVKPHHKPSWISRLRELSKRERLAEGNAKTAASLDELDLRSSHFPKIPKIATDKDSAMSDGGVSARHKFAREKNSFAVGHADKVTKIEHGCTCTVGCS